MHFTYHINRLTTNVYMFLYHLCFWLACGPNCKSCDDPGVCDVCNDGYHMVVDQCLSKSSHTKYTCSNHNDYYYNGYMYNKYMYRQLIVHCY